MKEYLKATIIVIGGLLLIGILLFFAPIIISVISVTWPLMVIPIIIILVANCLKRKNN